MATITVNVDDETAELFRTKAFHSFGKKKGVLGRAFGEAMHDWSAKKEFLDVCLKMLREGRDMGKLLYKKREELHERS
ncbi:hypothetical protein HY485_02105 [Candidatus Woesearchaeota archaeon]|nr:hypothetical protein [Candidatus Woesearchaeota archaeon]